MSDTTIGIRTAVYGFELRLSGSQLVLTAGGESLTAPIVLSETEAERLRLELTKARLWEWNQLDEIKAKAERRYRHYLGSWLVLCLAALSAYLGYPGYYPPVFLSILSIFIWWRAGYQEQRDEKSAQAERGRFVPEWSYLQQRLEASEPVTAE